MADILNNKVHTLNGPRPQSSKPIITQMFAVSPKPHKSHLSPHQKAIKRQKLERVIEWHSDENMFETHLIDSPRGHR